MFDTSHAFGGRKTPAAGLMAVLFMTVFLSWRLPAQTNPPITSASITSIRNALAAGGTTLLQFTGSVTASTPLVISQDNTVLDATGFSVTISGGNTSQVFNVASNIHFTVINLTITGGASIGKAGTSGSAGANNPGGTSAGDGGPGGAAGNGLGGALINRGFTVMENCIVSNNIAMGGAGGAGGNGGNASPSTGTGGNGGNGGGGGTGYGGAIYNLGTLTLTNCTIANNAANGGNGGNGGTNGSGVFRSYAGGGGTSGIGAGAGLYNLGTATIVNCTFNQNAAQSGSSPAAGGPPQSNGDGMNGANGPNSMGGGICNLGTETNVNCTFDQNLVVAGNGATGGPGAGSLGSGGNGGGGGYGLGGSIYNAGSTSITNCTFANDAATGGSGGAAGSGNFTGSTGANGSGFGASIANASGTFNLKNSILAYPSNGFCAFGTITDQGNNLSSDGTPAFSTTNSQHNLDPLLVDLDDNGGPTFTMALQPGSPAIDAIFDSSAPTNDQRGFPRPFGLRSDIGAFEYGSSGTNFLLAGQVKIGSVAFPGVTVQIGSSSVTTGSNGQFSLFLTGNANYAVAPLPVGSFSPTNASIILSSNVTNLLFTASNAPTIITNNTTNHTFQLTFSVIPTFTYRIQAATNLISTTSPPTNWVTLSTNTATSNTIVLVVPSTNFSQRFFRTVTP